MILKLLITLIFAGAALQKFTGTVAPNWDRWGYPRRFMYATGVAEARRAGPVLVAGPRAGWCRRPCARAAGRTWRRSSGTAKDVSHMALSAATLLLVVAQFVPVGDRMT